jgi:tRNA pseudouridine38-40 synthase
MNYRITIAYDGTDYQGWQMQAAAPTIQGVMTAALERLEGGPVTVYGAGRTDSGVHAEGQVASFRLTREWKGSELQRAINGNLPSEIRVLEAATVADSFHARSDARSKTYRYQIYAAGVMNPLLARYAWHHPYALDPARLIEDGCALLGAHDFTAFTVASCETKTRVRTLTDFRLETNGPLWSLYFSADGFLRYMVRTMVGSLIEANRGRLKADSMAQLIESRDRTLIGAPAPAKGLTLMKVEY